MSFYIADFTSTYEDDQGKNAYDQQMQDGKDDFLDGMRLHCDKGPAFQLPHQKSSGNGGILSVKWVLRAQK